MKRLLMAMTVVLPTLLASAVGAQSGSELLSQAFAKERIEGKLAEAITLYQRIASEFASDHALAAKALVQMGHAYEKLGKSDARNAYDRVVREYADQRELAAEAGTRLAALDRALASAPAKGAASGLIARQVWTGFDVDVLGSPSADGKYLSFTDWTTGALAVRDMVSGAKRQLTRKGTWSDSVEFAEFSVVSPDSSQIAYAWFNKDLFYDLRVIPRDGGEPRVLYRNEQIRWLRPCAWSPDGRTLAVELARGDRTNQLAVVSIADGSVHVLKTVDWRTPLTMEFSPDGRYLAYDFPPIDTAPERDIYVIAVDGSRESVVVRHPANDEMLGWFPDGQSLLFASDRTGTNGLWSIRVENGRAQGEPKLLKADIGHVVRSGFTRTGDYYYGLATGVMDIYTATLDPTTGTAINEPVRAKDRYEGGKSGGIWSADGERLAYAAASGANRQGPQTIAIETSTDGQTHVQNFVVPLTYLNRNHLAWLKNGSALVISGTDLKGRQGLFRFGLSNGEMEVLAHGILARHPSVSRDGRTVFYERRMLSRSDGPQFAVVARDLASGDERVVYPHGVNELALSPDGESLAFVTGLPAEDPTAGAKRSIRIMPARGGAYKEIYTLETPTMTVPLIWAADGKSLLFSPTSATAAADEVWRLSVAGGAPERIGVRLPQISNLSLHPDGRQLIVSAGMVSYELWVMQNLGSSSSKTR